MGRVRLSDPIRLPDGTVSTIAAELDAGRMMVRKVNRFHAPRSELGHRVAYFADFVGTTTGFEIGKTAYESRAGLPVSLTETIA